MKVSRVPFVPDGFAGVGRFASVAVDTAPWPDRYPYIPSVKALVAHTEDRILIRFEVEEDHVLASCTEANGPVWADSCVEFFVKRPDSDIYFNFETNCIGTGLSARRRSRTDFAFLPPELVSAVVRRSSLERTPIDRRGGGKWSLELEIPFRVIECDGCPDILMANFYKCGENTEPVHFLSWNPVRTAAPDFHRPEFFGKLIFD